MKLLLKTKTSPRCQTPKSGWIWVGSEPGNRIVVLSHFIFSTSGKSSGSYFRNIYIQLHEHSCSYNENQDFPDSPIIASSPVDQIDSGHGLLWSFHLHWSKGIFSMTFHDHDNCTDYRRFPIWKLMVMSFVLIYWTFSVNTKLAMNF